MQGGGGGGGEGGEGGEGDTARSSTERGNISGGEIPSAAAAAAHWWQLPLHILNMKPWFLAHSPLKAQARQLAWPSPQQPVHARTHASRTVRSVAHLPAAASASQSSRVSSQYSPG